MDLLNDLKTYPTIPRNDCKLLQIITAINQWLSVSNHASIARPFTAEIPSFCSAYFGNSKQNSLGFLHRNIPLADRNALVLLLDTNSLFISKLLALQSDSTLYHITPDYFPPTTQKLLQSADLSNLPAMYKNNITYKNSSSPKKDVKDTSELHQINFNIFEYYAFCFAYCPTLVLESNDNSLFNRFDPTKKSSIVLDSCYFDLLNSYLNYFCPRQPPTTKTTIVPETPKRNVGPFTPRTQPILQKPVVDVLDNSSIFQSPSIDSIPIALKNAHFVIESFIELWFCQNDYESFNVTSQSVPTYSKPNSYQMKCIGLFLNHLLSLNLQNITSEQVSRINTDRNAGQIGIIYDIHKANIYRCFSPKFYRFIALALQNWPTDDSITLIVDLWLDFAFPWKRINQYFSHEWASYVQENFLFYTRALQLFLGRTLHFDFYAATRPRSAPSPQFNMNNGVQPKTAKSGYLTITEKVMEYFSDDNLLEFIRALETALGSLDNYNTAHSVQSPALQRTPLTAAVQTPSFQTPITYTPKLGTPKLFEREGDITYQYRNSGPKTRNRIIALEGAYKYEHVFDMDSSSREYGSLINQLLNKLTETILRLKRTKKTQKSLVKTNEKSGWLSYFSLGKSQDQAENAIMNVELIEKNLQKINIVIQQICDIWSLPNPTLAEEFNQDQAHSDILMDEEDEDYVVNDAGVLQRRKSSNNLLTMRGKFQIAKGLKKSNIDTITVIPTERTSKLVRNDESQLLVTVFENIIAELDKLDETPFRSIHVKRLRVLANPANFTFVCLVIYLFGLLFLSNTVMMLFMISTLSGLFYRFGTRKLTG